VTLLDISADVQALADLLEEAGELTPEASAAVEQWFAELGGAEQTKLDNYCALIRSLQLRAAARKEEAERLAKRVRIDEATASWLKQNLLRYMHATGSKKIETDRYLLTRRVNGGKQPLEITLPVDQLSPLYQRVEVKADQDEIRAALEAGVIVDGCRLLPRGEHVEIR
jgi:hypothetical protein